MQSFLKEKLSLALSHCNLKVMKLLEYISTEVDRSLKVYIKVKVKQSRYRPVVTQRVPGI